MSDLHEAWERAKQLEEEQKFEEGAQKVRIMPLEKTRCAMCTPSVCICAFKKLDNHKDASV